MSRMCTFWMPCVTEKKKESDKEIYTPKIENVSSGETVYQRIILIYGRAGTMDMKGGTIVVHHDKNSFPSQAWPCTKSYFKSLVHLNEGMNCLTFEFFHPYDMSIQSSTVIYLNYVNVVKNPPLYLAILLAKDSPEEYDASPSRKEKEGNGLELAIKKLRMIAYLWQAFTGEQMARNGFGRRCFRFEEENLIDTLSYQEENVIRPTAKIHIIRSKYSLEEIRDVNLAQQNPKATRRDGLFEITIESIREYGDVFKSESPVHVAACILDSHWDGKLILGHAALGGGDDSLRLAIFGSHSMHCFPSCIEEVIPTFLDDTPIDTRYVANDNDESSTVWECANIGIGAFLHEVGHLLGAPHRQSGVMHRDYINLNRTFSITEPFSERAKTNPWKPSLLKSECSWHYLDMIRFRYHKLFALPSDPVIEAGNLLYYSMKDKFLAISDEGIILIEIYANDMYYGYLDFHDKPKKEIYLEEQSLRKHAKIPNNIQPLKAIIISAALSEITIKNFKKELLESTISLEAGSCVKSMQFGASDAELLKFQFDFSNKLDKLCNICIRSGLYIDGLKLIFNDESVMEASGNGGNSNDFPIDGPKGERIKGLYIWSNIWIDALQITTTWNRISPLYGTASGHYKYIVAPEGCEIVGFYGSTGKWCNTLGVIYIDIKQL
ncbi:hypothetical protein T552_00221 [Pneumocystis carinii B80]|uniref:Jacalin-type lectin domain-containing protein n=1 Tax=Pneumocystis carinii (strain B80) TaxID=1408658 RepID=A0A0W4ZT78_PNEC8|nr:hypothetical protein T552_00221 [Pneumocystis carinii B80]KTW31583.1 hypothetical protein T552_00221 [Pneumocystis carinii B80]